MVKMTQYTKELVAALRCISGVPTGKEDCEHCKYGQRLDDGIDDDLPDAWADIADEWVCDCDRIGREAATALEALEPSEKPTLCSADVAPVVHRDCEYSYEDIDGLVCSYGPLVACLGCGYKHDCGIHGCAILREVERRLTIGMVAHDGGNDHAEA